MEEVRTENKARKPLEGIVVLDMTRVLAGPFAGMMLADMGADVIKVENPDGGDDSRAFTPFQNGHSAYFTSLNRSKRGVTLNLKHEKGKEIFKKLAAKSPGWVMHPAFANGFAHHKSAQAFKGYTATK